MNLDASVTIRDRIDDLYRSDSRRVFASHALDRQGRLKTLRAEIASRAEERIVAVASEV